MAGTAVETTAAAAAAAERKTENGVGFGTRRFLFSDAVDPCGKGRKNRGFFQFNLEIQMGKVYDCLYKKDQRTPFSTGKRGALDFVVRLLNADVASISCSGTRRIGANPGCDRGEGSPRTRASYVCIPRFSIREVEI